jgi:hypothetical protein
MPPHPDDPEDAMTNICVCGCGRVLIDGYAHHHCMERTREHLATIGELLPVALDVAYGQTARSQTGGSGGGAEPRLELSLAAKARLDAVGNALTTWARHVAEERGVPVPGGDPIMAASAWLAAHCEWMRHRAEVAEFVADVETAARVIRGLASGPRERIYLGPCEVEFEQESCAIRRDNLCQQVADDLDRCEPGACAATVRTCDGSVYGRLGAPKATCKTCEAEYDQDQRIRERAELAHSYTYTAAEIEHAYGGVILASTIRQWRKRGLLTVHGEADGKRLYAIGEVLQVAATTKERQRRQAAEMGA